MIRIEVERLKKRLEIQEGKKITMKELSQRSGCDKNALSRLYNKPHITPSANVIDKLAQFFFNALENKTLNADPHAHMKMILLDMVQVFPDSLTNDRISQFKQYKTVPASVLWDFV